MSASRIRVLIAEDDSGVREVLASVVRSESTFELAAAVEDAHQAIKAEMFDVGADGYLVKGSLVTAIIASIQRAGSASASARKARAA